MLKKLKKFTLLSLLSFSLLSGTGFAAKAIDAEGKFTLFTAPGRNLGSSVEEFFEEFFAGRDGLKPAKRVTLEGSFDSDEAPIAVELEEDTSEEAKYTFTLPPVISSVVADLFNTELGKKPLRAKLNSVNSISGSFEGPVENKPSKKKRRKKKKSGSVNSVNSLGSVASVIDVSSSLRFTTSGVRAVRSKKKPNIVRLKGNMTGIAGLSGSRRRLGRGRFTIQFINMDDGNGVYDTETPETPDDDTETPENTDETENSL